MGSAPKPRGSYLRLGPKNFSEPLFRAFEIVWGTANPEGASEAEAPQRAGRGKSPEAVPDTGGRKVKQGGSNFGSEISGTEDEQECQASA